jgi:hypothetical protein
MAFDVYEDDGLWTEQFSDVERHDAIHGRRYLLCVEHDVSYECTREAEFVVSFAVIVADDE